MYRFCGIFALCVLSMVLFSCTCATPLKVSEIQKTDKKLACKDVILEINESEHYRELAKKERGISFGNFLMPVCWVTSYVDANRAVNAAQERIKYLGHIYDVLDCGGKSDKADKPAVPAAASVTPLAAPPIIQIQPAPAPAPVAAPTVSSAAKVSQCGNPQDIDKYTHKHVDRLGKIYTHCHVNTGPHRHLDDN